MFAFRKMRGVPISHPLGKMGFPAKIPEPRLEEIVTHLRSGIASRKEIEELAEGHVRLAIKIASGFAAKAKYKAEEFVSQAMLGIAYAINHAQERLLDNNITPYISACVNRFIFEALANDHVVHVPDRTVRDWNYKGLETKLPEVFSFGNMDHVTSVKSHEHLVDLLDLIRGSIRTEFESKVIELRFLGNTDQEVAEKLGCTQQYVNRVKLEVYARFKRAFE